MIWHILGAGSIGCLWAARLCLAGLPVRLILREPRLAALQDNDNRIGFTDLQQVRHNLRVQGETADNREPVRRLILSTKAYAARQAVESILHRLSPDSELILLQNGIGSQQEVAGLLPETRILVASSTEGAFLQGSFHCVHAGQGQTLLGDLQAASAAPAWLAQLDRAGIPCQWQDNIHGVLWRKLAINCLINPLTVLHRCRNGELAAHGRQLAVLAGELESLLHAAGQPAAAQDLYATVMQVIHATAANTSSMLQDVQQGRRTEISYITGHALQQSRILGLPCPHLQALHDSLQQQLRKLGLPDF